VSGLECGAFESGGAATALQTPLPHPALRVFLAVAAIAFASCGREMTTPTNLAPLPAADAVVTIVANNGGASFNPNPAAGRTVAWKNGDKETHRIVANDGTFDTGNLAPGSAVSVTVTKSTAYHCAIHPTMVGSVVFK